MLGTIILIIVLLIYSESDHIIYHLYEQSSAGVPLPTRARSVVRRLITLLNEINFNLTLVDFGCSNGDFINYIVAYHLGPIIGVEIDEKQASETLVRFANYNRISIINDNMINQIIDCNSILYMYEPMWLSPDKAIDVYAQVLANCSAMYIIYVSGVTQLISEYFFSLFNYKLAYQTYISRMLIFSNGIFLYVKN